ncbi:MAG TPA: VCBS repeat-containing protein, partial [Terrabacter sp.]|nr:VCBS repeat-containing protein [Terrabacter sp.]
PAVVVGRGWNIFDVVVGVGDLTGDQRADLVARRTSDGSLYLYAGTGTGGWRAGVVIGRGWNVMNVLVGVGDWNGDGRADLLARERATGYLWVYPGNGAGGFGLRTRLGTGTYNGLTAIAGAGDLNGDRTADLVGRDGAGNLWLYPGNGSGAVGARSLLGTGWNIATAIL